MNNIKSSDIKYTVLVPSTDPYSDLWAPFLTYFFRYWPEQSQEVLLGSNNFTQQDFEESIYENQMIKICNVGESKSWGEHTIKLLENVDSEIVLLIMPDYFLNREVDDKQFLTFLNIFISKKMNYMTLNPGYFQKRLHRKGFLVQENLKLVDANYPYAITLQTALWRKSALISLLSPEDSPWSFELKTFEPNDASKWSYSTEKVISHSITGSLIRGRYKRRDLARLRKNGINLTEGGRKKLTYTSCLIYSLRTASFFCPSDNFTLRFQENTHG